MMNRRALLCSAAVLPVVMIAPRAMGKSTAVNALLSKGEFECAAKTFTEEGRAILDAKPGDYYINTRNDDVFVGVARSDNREGVVWVKLGEVA